MTAVRNPYRTRAVAMFGLCALSSLLFTLLTPLWYGMTEPMYLLMLGVGTMLCAIPLHLLASSKRVIHGSWRRMLYWPAMLVNVVGTSMCEAAYYTHIEVEPARSVLLAGALVPILLCLIFAAITAFLPDRYGLLTLICGLLTLALIIVSIVCWVKTDADVLFSFAFFHLLGVLTVDIALLYACEDEESSWLRFLSFASFGLLMIVAAVVLLILLCAGGADSCDCDCGDCCDGCDCGGGGSQKAKKK